MKVWLVGGSLTKGLYASTEAKSFAKLFTAQVAKTWELEPVEDAQAGANVATMAANYPVPTGLDLAVVELGTNDAGKGTEVGAFTKQYAKYLAGIKKASPSAALVCLGVWGNGANGEVTPFNLAISQQCGAAGGKYIDLSGLYMVPEMRSVEGTKTWAGEADSFHPSDTGHAAIAKYVMDELG